MEPRLSNGSKLGKGAVTAGAAGVAGLLGAVLLSGRDGPFHRRGGFRKLLG